MSQAAKIEEAPEITQEVLPPIEIDTCGASVPMVIESRSVMSFFKPAGLDPILEKIKADVKAMNLDISTAKGRDEIRSVARKIAGAKVKLDETGKDLVAHLKAQTGAIDAERKRMRDDLDAFKEDVRKPLTEWEDREKNRVAGHEAALLDIIKPSEFEENLTAEEIQKRMDACKNTFNGRDWEEFGHRALNSFTITTEGLNRKLDARKKYDKEQAELEQLRKEKADREQKERDERIAKEAADKAKAEAEAEAKRLADEEAARVKAEQDKAEQARLQLEREKEDERQRAEKAEREKKEADARAAKAEADKKAAEEQAARDKVAADARAEEERKASEERTRKAAEEATKREQDRQAEEKRKEEKDAADREADKTHKKKINNEALAVISALTGEDITEKESSARKIVEAIAQGKIPHVKITY